jgi:hypothetical protein
MGEMKNSYNMLVPNLKGKGCFGDINTDVRIILKW